MIDLVVDRREMKSTIANALRFMSASPATTSVLDAAVTAAAPEPVLPAAAQTVPVPQA
jgi:hypothetical protein